MRVEGPDCNREPAASGRGFALAKAGDPPDFSRYPQTHTFVSRLHWQTNGAVQLAQTNLLEIQERFDNNNTLSDGYSVKQYGLEEDGRLLTYAGEAFHKRQLFADSMKSLRLAISELASHNETPPLDRLLVVSFSDGTNWITRSYDSQAPPPALLKIFDIINKAPEIGF